MELQRFGLRTSGVLVPISGTDQSYGEWTHRAFVPDPLPDTTPNLGVAAFMRIADARAALAALDGTARQLDNPQLLRQPTLRREAQSTSALEGTYAPLGDVLTADEHDVQDLNLREVLNYVRMADAAYAGLSEERPLSVTRLCELQKVLVGGTRHEDSQSGQIRSVQVVVGQRQDVDRDLAPIFRSRFVPPPPGNDLRFQLASLMEWKAADHSRHIDPVAKSGMAHYQFETLHPFHDGNGRLGRFLMTVDLLTTGVLSEPTLTVSPWFEARRTEYYDRLLAVSTDSDWDGWLAFYAEGLAASAEATRTQMLALLEVRAEMTDAVRDSKLRAGTAFELVEYAVAHPSFTVRQVQRNLGLSYGRANGLVDQLVGLGLLRELPARGSGRRFYAPRVLEVLTS
ncbi:Fic family protein [Enemella evansiae]|uniref:Fic family protein n=1 Tax=Enemella evansiae TaxID=2016499 RepID=UPI0010DE4353|nr:Fic/DOC family N-terminal domain-containing protein [Enemella evansiae]TDO86017.1 Fic family protein [Enemella evansiae]